jgi:hypothetical protein
VLVHHHGTTISQQYWYIRGVGKDPVLRVLGGCAIVAAVVVAIVVCIAVGVGWNLTRDPAQGRAPETFLVGDETRYFRLDLRADDAGLKKLFERLDAINDESRRRVLHGTFLENVPLPRRRARLEDIAPFTLEGSLFMSDPASGLSIPTGWAARGTFSHDVLRMRAGLKVMRWLFSRDAAKSTTIDIDGIAVTEVHDKNATFALASVGNRVLATNDASRMRAVLRPRGEPKLEGLSALHEGIKLDGEDAWAFLSNTRVGGLSHPVAITGAAASFDLSDRDELAFRIAVLDGGTVDEGSAFRGTHDECLAVVSSFLPVFAADAIELAAEGAHPLQPGSLVFSGRVAGLSKYLPDLPKRLAEFALRSTAKRMEDQAHPPSSTETPSATPTPPSPPQPVGPRTGTPAGPKREGSPKPPR